MTDARDGIKWAIRKSGLKQLAVAERIGITSDQLSEIVNKRRKLDADLLFKICEVVGVTPNDVFSANVQSRQ